MAVEKGIGPRPCGPLPETYQTLRSDATDWTRCSHGGVHPEFCGDYAGLWSGREAQKASHGWLIRCPINAAMAGAPDSLHGRPLPFNRVATSCLEVDFIIPEPITYPFRRDSK